MMDFLFQLLSVLCKVYTGYHGTSEIEHGLCACTVDNPLAKARGLSLRTGAQTMLYLSLGDWGQSKPDEPPHLDSHCFPLVFDQYDIVWNKHFFFHI